MEIKQETKDQIEILHLIGRLDTLSSKDLGLKVDQMIEANRQKIVIDFSELRFISSSGLRVLLAAAKQVSRVKGSLALCGLNSKVKEVFDVAGFTMLFSMYSTLDQALSKV